MKKLAKKLKRGISLVEVIVSIFIITLISASATTIILTSAKNEQVSLRDTQIALATETTIECFRFADDIDEFYSVLYLADNDFSKQDSTITLNKEGFSLDIIADFTAKQIVITALDKKGQELSSVSYKKG
ncbi:MAG: hypothetical protein E7372_04930 [Clostridiales bacterium]|nr:hypothetical protein [Clostridiales bacterium]